MLKDAIIGNYSNYAPAIEVKIWNDTFMVSCNKFKTVDSTVKMTTAYSTDKKKFATAITRQPVRVPDYKRFKLFWATCLIHNLDSQVMDRIAYLITDWMLTIHDAVIALPGTLGRVRKLYAKLLKEVNTQRAEIIRDYRRSIGATSMKADIDFMKLYQATHQAEDVEFSPSAMK